MPRPKVPPDQRLRAYEACIACRMTKKRCSGTFPCAKCIRMNRAASCVPARTGSQRSTSRPARSPVVRQPGLIQSPLSESHSTPYSSVSNHSPRDHRSTTSTELGSRSPEAVHRTRPRMLRNLQGERVYVGRAASLSFLQLVRDTVTQHIGPSQFSHNVKSENMLETETPQDIPPIVEASLEPSQIQALLHSYRIAINGFIYLPSDLQPEDLNSHHTAAANIQRTKSALRDIKIAIGAQSTQNDPTTVQVERFFFARGQRVAFAGMIETPSLELVKLFLLMAFYMMGACRRNAAFMYLGVAARAAVALGLHLKDSKTGSIEEQRERTCVWMSLCTLDLMSSSILGRPPATANIRSEYNERQIDLEDPSPMEERLLASYRMSQILDEIIVRLYGETAASADTAESLLETLNAWSNSLPGSVLSSPSPDTEPLTAQAHIVGSLHIACSYHFAVIIVSRPFLISSLGVRLARVCNSPGKNDGLLQEDAAHAKLASACTDSALYMMQTCMEVYHSGLLLGNMCILKAFVFAAALVLGFSMFSRRDSDSAVEQAFHGALEILRTLAQQSAQASHYYEILSSLKNAIAEQRQRLMQYAPQNKNRYVSKLFSLNNDRPLANAPTRWSVENDDLMPATPNILDSWASMDTAVQYPAFSGWEGMELPLWDSFPFIDGSLPVSNRSSESNPAT